MIDGLFMYFGANLMALFIVVGIMIVVGGAMVVAYSVSKAKETENMKILKSVKSQLQNYAVTTGCAQYKLCEKTGKAKLEFTETETAKTIQGMMNEVDKIK